MSEVAGHGWTHPICRRCWEGNRPNQIPYRLRETPQNERCCLCGTPTTSGIYIRCVSAGLAHCPDEREKPMNESPGGLVSDELIARLTKLRTNDVYVEIIDAEWNQPRRMRVHDAQYDPGSDTIIILAHINYR